MTEANHYHITVSDKMTPRALAQMIANFATGIIVLFVFLPHLVPASLVMTVESLAYLPDSQRMLQERTVKLRNPELGWTAQIHELGSSHQTLLCQGDGQFVYAKGNKRFSMEIDRWVGEDGCQDKMKPGGIYIARATWTYDWLIHKWTTEAVSPPFTYNPSD